MAKQVCVFADGLYGAFIVEANRQSRPKSNSELMVRRTDGEFTVMLNDWFHDESAVQMQRLHSKPFRFWGNPSTILFNGKAKPREGFYSSPAAAGCVRVDATGPLTTPQHEVRCRTSFSCLLARANRRVVVCLQLLVLQSELAVPAAGDRAFASLDYI